jgi:hypothetical protein
MGNDTQDPATNLEPVACGECGQLVGVIDDDTRIGISRLDGTPAPLCSPACAAAHPRRGLEAAPRCRCGADVDLDQELLTRAGEVLGCQACRWSGRPAKAGCAGCGHVGGVVACFCSVAGCDCPAPANDLHYLSGAGAALCGTTSRRAGRPITTTKDRGAVGCLVCVGLLELAPVLVGAGIAS